MYPSTEPLPQPDHPRQGHHYDVSLGEAPSSGYIPGHAQSWRVIDETIGIDEHADAAREAAQPPASRLGESFPGWTPPQPPDRYIDDQSAHGEPYSTTHPGEKPLA